MRALSVFVLFLFATLPVQAAWYLDSESSRLSFISTQSGNQAEVHRFLSLRGQVDASGEVELRIDLGSVRTGIPLRDERMRNLLFKTREFAEARIEGRIALGAITNLAPGAQLELRLPLSVNLHGKSSVHTADLLVTRLDDRRFQVVTLEPLILGAEAFGLADGVEALRSLAEVPVISLAVPVSAVLIFTAR